MCSVNGVILPSGTDNIDLEQVIKRMQHATAHRGPDQSNHQLFNNAVIGVSRLAIVAPDDHQLIHHDEAYRLFATLNGEIVNYRSLAEQLSLSIEGKSDGEIILPMIEKYGQKFVEQLAGMFSIAVYNSAQHKLQLWRDPMGIKPLYYFHKAGKVIFSSEIKAIQAALGQSAAIDFSALDHILRYRFNPGRGTAFKGIYKVLPGETVTFVDGKEMHERYWVLKSNHASLKPDVSVQAFRELFSTVIAENAASDVSGGFFTSGGLDSSLVTARTLAIDDSTYKQPISIKFTPNPVADEQYGQMLEDFLGTKFEWVEVSDERARQTLEKLVPFLDEPLENPIHVGTYLMAERAKELGLKSVLTGDGSDEFFLGYERHANWFKHPDPVKNYPSLSWTMSPDDASELYLEDVLQATTDAIDSDDELVEPILNITEALQFERAERLPEYHNNRLDRMTMAHSIEARVPFLDHRIIAYSLQVPTKTLFGDSGKEWLQQVAEPWLPKEILKRPKVLFPSLPDQWLSGKGASWAAEILLNPSAYIAAWMKRATLERYITDHAKKTKHRGKLLWALVTLELWLQHQSKLGAIGNESSINMKGLI